jgi:AcrR family transcriptional regulator
MEERTRSYRQTARADAAAETAQRVLIAAGELLLARWYDDVSLQDIAAHAGVTARTIQRRFGSKDGVVREFFRLAGRENAALRDTVATGDVDGAIATIVGFYESDGNAVVRYLSLEERFPAVAEVVGMGRALHRKWVERVFAPMLPVSADARRTAVALLIVATDVYTWKLLRRDAGLSRAAVTKAMKALAVSAVRPATGETL